MKRWILRGLAFLLLAGGALLVADGCWIKAKGAVAQLLLQHAWNETREAGEPVKPWPWADTWPVARLQVSRLGVDMIVLQGEHGEALAFGPGLLRGSGKVGEGGHCIVAGHRDSSFSFLKDLRQGDVVTLESGDGRVTSYRVEETAVVEAAGLYLQESAKNRLTLLTCYPFGGLQSRTGLRYLVFAEGIQG